MARVAVPARSLEYFYGQGLYPVVQALQAAVFGWWPVSASLLGLIVLTATALWALARAITKTRALGWAAWRAPAVGLTRLLAALAAVFLIAWGFNYGRPDVPGRLAIATSSPRVLLATDTLVAEYARTAAAVNRLRHLKLAPDDVNTAIGPREAQQIGEALRVKLAAFGVPTVRLRRLRVLPKGTLLRFGTAGVYSPWTGDPHVDGGLHPLQQRFTAAHELAHQQGITDEGDCNLLAYLTLAPSADALLAYSAELTYLRYLRAAISRRDRETFEGLTPKLDTAVLADLRAIRRAQDAFAEIAPAARDLVYDGYLRTQGVHDGLSSYGRIIDYVVAVRRARPGLLPESR